MGGRVARGWLEKGTQNSHGARPVHLIFTVMKQGGKGLRSSKAEQSPEAQGGGASKTGGGERSGNTYKAHQPGLLLHPAHTQSLYEKKTFLAMKFTTRIL